MLENECELFSIQVSATRQWLKCRQYTGINHIPVYEGTYQPKNHLSTRHRTRSCTSSLNSPKSSSVIASSPIRFIIMHFCHNAGTLSILVVSNRVIRIPPLFIWQFLLVTWKYEENSFQLEIWHFWKKKSLPWIIAKMHNTQDGE